MRRLRRLTSRVQPTTLATPSRCVPCCRRQCCVRPVPHRRYRPGASRRPPRVLSCESPWARRSLRTSSGSGDARGVAGELLDFREKPRRTRQLRRTPALRCREEDRTRSTGTGASRTSISASLPITRREKPRRPCVPTTTRSARHCFAYLMICSATWRPSVSNSTTSTETPCLRALASARARTFLPLARKASLKRSM